ncbi:TonB-dependent receptor plug domain-containing protein [Massilia niastensis]|uniref:TonB-dependent receptor plug domain-containing protein n=1 Tax=Massilia niastensis TaxID=544911 RepID=UPI0003A13CC5|nr:TonB-dependent receptor [Massilia niastensis]
MVPHPLSGPLQPGPSHASRLRPGRSAIATAVLALTVNTAACALDAQDIGELSLEELANIKVTSVSKRPEALSEAASSIFVITGSEIRRSGVATLPEALRLAPNLQVARVDARNYAVSARGFNNPFENKLLVLIDGRTVYSPLFSGVFWDAQDVVLEDVERIEVISGPGATMWGANAVNGVINIITRSASDTQGALVSAAASRDERHGAGRYGGKLANGGHYRAYAKYAANDDTETAAGAPVPTGWHRRQAGFRADWGDTARNFVLQGDVYEGKLTQVGTEDIRISGANLLGRLNRTLAGGSTVTLQTYWDHTERDQPLAFVEDLDTLDVQLQHAVKLANGQDIVWGGGYRWAHDRVRNGPAFGFLPGTMNLHWGNLFAQGDFALRDGLRLTAGLKLEENNYTGVEVLPTLRLAWKPQAHALAWSSLSRSVRAPSRIDRDLFSPTTPRVVNGVPQFAIAGGPDFASEVANVAELGYRAQPTPALSWSATAFYSRYDRLRTLEPNQAGSSSVFRNLAEGRTRGIEAWANWQASGAWRLSGGTVVQRVDTTLDPASRDLSGTTGLATSDPRHYWMLRSSYDLAPGRELDVTLRRVGALSQPVVPAYTAVDLRLGWRIRKGLELSLVGQNLFDSAHAEFGAPPGRSEYRRAALLTLVWNE